MTARKRFRLEYHERTALGFVQLLSPVSGILAAAEVDADLIYRGHGSNRYGLIPNAHRRSGFLFLDRRFRGRRTVENQLASEVVNLAEFFKLANARGLKIPEDSQALRRMLASPEEFVGRVVEGKEVWPPERAFSALALAQHYGMLTRLLDWTYRPYVAAYFAANGALSSRSAGRLSVWAFNREVLNREMYDRLDRIIQVVTAPASDIPNLSAQHGLFLAAIQGKPTRIEPFRAQPLDRIIIDRLGFFTSGPMFYQFTLPTSQASELLRHLHDLGVDASSVFPGYQGVVNALEERALHPRYGSSAATRACRHAKRRYAPALKRWRRQEATWKPEE